ncbi:FIST signal transduction protein [Clostridium saccharobutylicum]|uniref:FIST N domain protein n=1 Tax=Clostridium saccharobutylicum TaxID=169679 RepID=A0A1S8MYR2_CLOSA|nr:FIST N-terminal domain-containing protein [Clostridium saccharobutylicum]OOM09338.1 FIST N domain protein [Clostridium saccharobutylicum]
MAGRIKEIIDEIIRIRSRENPAIAEMTIAKLILKGFNPNKFDKNSIDDEVIIEKLYNIAKQLNVNNLQKNEINIKSAVSTKQLEKEIVDDIKRQLNISKIKLVIFFASPNFNQAKISKLMQEEFNDCVVVGCSTAGEIASGKLLENSVVAMGINSNIISDVKVEVIENMKQALNLEAAFASFEKYYNESLYNMDSRKYVGMTLIDGISMKEEKIMDSIGNRTNVFFVGGSSGDNYKFTRTYVCANGKAYTDASVLVLLKINCDAEFDIIKTQSFKALNKTLIANKVNEECREVVEFNHKPASLAYKESIGLCKSEDIENYFVTNPLGLVVGENDIFVRSPQRVNNTNMLFYCNILKGMEVRLLKPTNIIEDTEKILINEINEFGNIDGIINFQCLERTREIKKNKLQDQYCKIFDDITNIGFSAYGEQYIGHLNQTSVMLVFRLKK